MLTSTRTEPKSS